MTEDRRSDDETRDRLEELSDVLEAREARVGDRETQLAGLARKLLVGAVVGGVLVVVALALGAAALSAQRHQRFDALVQSCEARNAQNVGIVSFLASVDRGGRRPAEVAADRRVAPFFPVHGFTLPDGRPSAETHKFCEKYAHSLTSG